MVFRSTIYNFDVSLADVNRNLYCDFSTRAALHPTESLEHLIIRTLAYILEYEDGISFAEGLSDPNEPTMVTKNLYGEVVHWIDIGPQQSPDPTSASVE